MRVPSDEELRAQSDGEAIRSSLEWIEESRLLHAGFEARTRRRPLPRAPLGPDAFLRWAWKHEPQQTRGPGPLTLEDVWFAHGGSISIDDLRREYIRTAARVRANQRIGRDPWEGVVRP